MFEHATFAPVDVYTKTDPVVELTPTPVIEHIAPSAAESYPSFVPSFVQIHEAVTDSENPKFSITDDKTSQVSVERIQEQSAVSDLVTSVESSPVPLLHAVEYVMPEPRVPAPQIQEQMIVQGIPRAQIGERIQEQIAETISQETVQQRTDEQMMAVAAPCAATDSPAPPMSMIGHAMLTPVDVYTKTAPVIEPMAAPVIEYIAPSPAVSYPSAFSSDIPRVQVVKRIRGKRAHQRTVEQNVPGVCDAFWTCETEFGDNLSVHESDFESHVLELFLWTLENHVLHSVDDG